MESKDEESKIPSQNPKLNEDLQSKVNLPLKFEEAHYQIDIHEQIALIKIKQNFSNQSSNNIEAIFNLPKEPDCPISKFEVVVDDKIIVGKIQEKEKAEERYDDAIASGNQAFMAKEVDDNTIQMNLGNIKPFQEVQINLELSSILTIEKGCYCFRMTRKYFRYPLKYERSPSDCQKFPNLEDFNTLINNLTKAKISLDVNIHSQNSIKYVHCPMKHKNTMNQDDHLVSIQFELQATQFHKEILRYIGEADDFKIYYRTDQIGEPVLLAQESEEFKDEVAIMLQYTPVIKDENESNIPLQIDDSQDFQPQEKIFDKEPQDNMHFIFLIDQSGSMQGLRNMITMKALKLFLQSLPPNSYFTLIPFGSSEIFYKNSDNPNQYNDNELEAAINYIENLRAEMGGTNIWSPLQKAIEITRKEQGLINRIFLLTDGEDYSHYKIIDHMKKMNDKPQIYTFGIGTSSGEQFVQQLAEVSKAICQIVPNLNTLKSQIIQSLQKAMNPTLQKIHFQLNSQQIISQHPESFLFKNVDINRQITMHFTISKSDLKNLEINIDCDESSVVQDLIKKRLLSFKDIHFLPEGKSLFQLQARKTITRQSQSETYNLKKKELIEMALRYQVLSPDTAFIAINKDTKQKITAELVKHDQTLIQGQEFGRYQNVPHSPIKYAAYQPSQYQPQIPLPMPPLQAQQISGNQVPQAPPIQLFQNTQFPPSGPPYTGLPPPPQPPLLMVAMQQYSLMPPPGCLGMPPPPGMSLQVNSQTSMLPPPPLSGMPPPPSLGMMLPPPGMAPPLPNNNLSFADQISQAASTLKQTRMNQSAPISILNQSQTSQNTTKSVSHMDQLKQQIMLRKQALGGGEAVPKSTSHSHQMLSKFNADDSESDQSNDSSGSDQDMDILKASSKHYLKEEFKATKNNEEKKESVISVNVDTLIDLQSSAGFWKSYQQLDKWISQEKLEKLKVEALKAFNETIACTIIAIVILNLNYLNSRDEWILIERKAKNWLKTQKVTDIEIIMGNVRKIIEI